MGIRVVLEGRKPPVWEVSGDTLTDFTEQLESLGVNFDLLLAESESVARFQRSGGDSAKGGAAAPSGGNLRVAPSPTIGDDSGGHSVPPPPPTETVPAGETGDGTQGAPCAECGSVMDLLPKQAKKLYGREDICSDCGDAIR